MPTLVFERTRFTVECPEGAWVREVSDEHPMAAVPYACRHANCGSCRVRVEEGMDLCEAPEAMEQALLTFLQTPPEVRLACQLRVRPGSGTVRLRVLR